MLLPALAGAFLIAGCGGGSSSTTGTGGGGSGAATPAATGSGGSPTGRSLVQLDTLIAPSLDLDGTAPANFGFEQAILNLSDTLVEWPTTETNGVLIPNYKAGPMQFQPALAASYSRKGLTWTFNLRKGVKSCAGNELTSADVVYSFARAKSVSGPTPTADFVGTVGGVFSGKELTKTATAADKKLGAEVKAIGRYKVQITQDAKNELFPKILTTWLMAPFDSVEMKKHATAKDPWSHDYTATTNAPMFGPYCLSSWQKGSQITFTANKGYWRGTPEYSKVTVRGVPSDAQRVAGIGSGQADIATGLTPAEYQRLGSTGASVLKWANNANSLQIGINYKYAPFNDETKGRLLRQAIAYALPYDTISKDVYFGQLQQDRGLIPANSYGFTPIDTYSTNLEKAKALMAQAGYPGGKGLPAGSKAFSLSYTAERSATLQPIANLIRTALAGIGFPIKLNPIPSAQEETSESSTHVLGMFIRDDSRALVPDVGYSTLLYLASAKAGGLVASTNYANPKIDALYAASAKQTGAARLQTLAQIQKIAMNDLPLVPIGSVQSQLAVKKGITGWLGNTYDMVLWQNLKSGAN